MRTTIVLLLLIAACGKKSPGDTIDAPTGDAVTTGDGPLAIDARPHADAAVATCTPTGGTSISTQTIASGLSSPVWITSPPGDKRLFVVEQPGRIRIIDNGLLPTPFLDISLDNGGPVNDSGNEQGLLGLAFHPDYANNGRFYVHYTRSDNAIVIAEYKVSASDPNKADATSARVVLVVPHPGQQNHNSGTIEFGPDGKLWITTGDGGGGGDTNNNAQNKAQLLGKMLRIDVDARTGSKEYGIPSDNPFASSPDGATDPRPEIWSYGWRNPYRWDFDSNGDLIVADVGQGLYEEVDVIPKGTAGGKNYGWHVMEGLHCYDPATNCDMSGLVLPQVEQPHQNGWCAIIGGVVYRGACYPDLVGKYFYTDNCLHQLWSFTPASASATNAQVPAAMFPTSPTAIHTDATGEMYVTARDGTVRHIIAGP